MLLTLSQPRKGNPETRKPSQFVRLVPEAFHYLWRSCSATDAITAQCREQLISKYKALLDPTWLIACFSFVNIRLVALSAP